MVNVVAIKRRQRKKEMNWKERLEKKVKTDVKCENETGGSSKVVKGKWMTAAGCDYLVSMLVRCGPR